MPPTRRPGAAQAASQADVPSHPTPPGASSPAARAALLDPPSGYNVAFNEALPPSLMDDFSSYASKHLRRCVERRCG